MKIKFFIVLSAAALMACQSNAPPTANQTAKPTRINSANTAPVAPQIKTFEGKGVITKINLKIGSVELDHEEIKGAMPAMQMEFYVSDKKMLDNLTLGDKVDFVLEDNAGAERIISIKKNQGK